MIGKIILNYKILEKLGEGGMGVVYLAEDTRLKRQVAIKFLPRHVSANEEERRRFEIEAQAAAALNHPNITQIYAIEEADDELFIVMEYVEGKELKELINTPHVPPRGGIKGGVSSIESTLSIATQIAAGLQAAHEKGIVHRDIKPSNIMITDKGQVKIMDFGLAKVGQGMQLTKEQSTLGTAPYMSPEQARGDELDQRTDIWSFGVVLYEMLTGHLPFTGDYDQAVLYSILNEEPKPLQTIRPETPLEICEIIQKMIQKVPEKRINSMEEIGKLLQQRQQKPEQEVKERRHSIAVLPFTDISPAHDQAYFCEGIAEEILIALNRIEGLPVASRTSSFQFRESNKDIREIGKILNVNSVLEGSVRKSGNQLRINVQLTNVSDGFYLWSDRYDRELEDVFAIQENIAENVAIALRGFLTPKEKEAIRRPETVIEAYECFLRGRQFLNQFTMDESKAMFQQAITLDPEYAPAYAGLADVHSWLYEWFGANPSDLEVADQNSLKALELASHLAESHISRGYVFALGKKYEEAEKEFQLATDLDPNAFDAYYYHARSCFARGDIKKSAELFRKAGEVRIEDFQSMSLLAQSLLVLGEHEASEQANLECIRRAERQLELDPSNRRAISLIALALHGTGQEEKSFQYLERGLKLHPEDTGVLLNGACLMARAGRKEEAIDLIEKVFGKGYGKKDWIEHDPDYDSLRDDPRFQALMKKLS